MPAQVPRTGMPSAARAASGSTGSRSRASLAIVVDSPPGIDQRVDPAEIARRAHLDGVAPERRRSARRARGSRPAARARRPSPGGSRLPAAVGELSRRACRSPSPAIASPRPRETFGTMSGSLKCVVASTIALAPWSRGRRT